MTYGIDDVDDLSWTKACVILPCISLSINPTFQVHSKSKEHFCLCTRHNNNGQYACFH